jgi:hypothetical protein
MTSNCIFFCGRVMRSEESQTASSGKPAGGHASRPPRNALAAVIPTSLSNCAARALLLSFVQVQ